MNLKPQSKPPEKQPLQIRPRPRFFLGKPWDRRQNCEQIYCDAERFSLASAEAERAGVRWGMPESVPMEAPASPSQRFALRPSLSPLKGGEGR